MTDLEYDSTTRICNRCNQPRPQTEGICPNCGCPEFRLARKRKKKEEWKDDD